MDSDRDLLEMVAGAMKAGAAGLSIGRNVFQHPRPSAMIQAMSMIVREGYQVDDALAVLSARCTQKAA
jgi:DhnA family fructose-bisphosphate aldolase class Ia